MKSNRIKLSIITINLNNKLGLVDTINSIRMQRIKDGYEFIIIDGGSRDGSLEIIESSKEIVHLVHSEPDGGIYNAMNKGVKLAKGEYCLFLNSGDFLWSPMVLQEVLDLNLTKAFNIFEVWSPQVGLMKTRKHYGFWHFYLKSIPHQGCIILRDLLLNKPYSEDYKIVSDWKWAFEELVYNGLEFKTYNVCLSGESPAGISGGSNSKHRLERQSVLNILGIKKFFLSFIFKFSKLK